MRADIDASAAVRAAAPARLRAKSRRLPSPARATGGLFTGLLLAAFVVLFILPVVWLRGRDEDDRSLSAPARCPWGHGMRCGTTGTR